MGYDERKDGPQARTLDRDRSWAGRPLLAGSIFTVGDDAETTQVGLEESRFTVGV